MQEDKPHFLIVDDDPMTCELLAAMLDSFGCKSEIARSSKAAMSMLEKKGAAAKFDGVFLDIIMPEANGIEVLASIRKNSHTQDLPVIMLTSMDTSSSMMSSYQNGASYYMTKPFCSHQVVYGLDLVMGDSLPQKAKLQVHEIPEDFIQ